MPNAKQVPYHPRHEHSVPWFWPMAAAIEIGTAGLALFQKNLHYMRDVQAINAPSPPTWATANRIVLELDTVRLRDFSPAGKSAQRPVLVDAPYAGHSSTIADFAVGHSLVETLLGNGLDRVLVTDWRSATAAMKDFDIDTYLADIDRMVDHLGGKVALVGLCQGGWMSAMYAARFPAKVVSLVLAGAPIDTDAGDGPIKKMAHSLPIALYEEMVAAGHGCMSGQVMLAGWKGMNPDVQYLGKYLDLYAHIEDKCYVKRTEHFEAWYENPIDLPGAYYLQVIAQIFKENRFARGEFVALGQRLSLGDIHCPVYLLAGAEDDITTREQVFDAEKYLGTPPAKIIKKLVPGGHIGLFMGAKTLTDSWPGIARWIGEQSAAVAA